MKFSCELDDITYIVSTSLGAETEFKYIYFLDSNERDDLRNGLMHYYTIHIDATKDDRLYKFQVQGVPLHDEQEQRLDDVEDFFEGQKLFSKVAHMINLEEKECDKPHWAKY